MRHPITAHVFREKPDFARLGELPKSIPYRAYLHRRANLYLLDTYHPGFEWTGPFRSQLPLTDIPLELPTGLETLERIYSRIVPLNLGNGFKKSYINTAMLLNRLLQVPVFSFILDEDRDFACSVDSGTLTRMKCRCGDLVISYDRGKVQMVPLLPPVEENKVPRTRAEELCAERNVRLTDIAALKSVLPDVEILPRETPWNSQFKRVAIEELRTFTGIEEIILSLESSDPNPSEDKANWELIASR